MSKKQQTTKNDKSSLKISLIDRKYDKVIDKKRLSDMEDTKRPNIHLIRILEGYYRENGKCNIQRENF